MTGAPEATGARDWRSLAPTPPERPPRRGFALSRWPLWAEADPTLRTALVFLVIAGYLIQFTPLTRAIWFLSDPLAQPLMDVLGDVGALSYTYEFVFCLLFGLVVALTYFACGWLPPPEQGPQPHGLGPALRATVCYLLAQVILSIPFIVIATLILDRKNLLMALADLASVSPLITVLLLPAFLFNGLLAFTLGLGAYWLARRLSARGRTDQRPPDGQRE